MKLTIETENLGRIFNLLGHINLQTSQRITGAYKNFINRKEGNAVVVNDKELGIKITIEKGESDNEQ